jgi:hypothetical protein
MAWRGADLSDGSYAAQRSRVRIFYDHVMNHKVSYSLTLTVALCGEIVLSERGFLPVLYEGLFLALAPQLVVQELQSTERGEFLPSLSMISLLQASQPPHSRVLFFFCLESLFLSPNLYLELISESVPKISSPTRGAAIQLIYINKWGLLGGHSHIKRLAHDTSSDLFALQILW